MRLPDGNHPRLHRREPEGERAAVVLDQDPDEALERAEERPVDDEDAVLAVVRPHVRQAELGGHLVVELDRSHLPASSEDVRHVEVDLRAVERCPHPREIYVWDPVPLQRRLERALGP